MDFKDYYKILGVEKNATTDDIKKAFKKLAKVHHPDANKGDNNDTKFKEINEAYEVLKDPEKRAKYDRLGSSWNSHRSTGGSADDFNWNEWANRQRTTRKRSGQTVGDMFDNSGGISDFFEKIFGGGFSGAGAKTRPAAVKGEDIATDLEISLEEAYSGTTKLMSLNNEKIEVKIKPGISNNQLLKLSNKGMPGKNGGKNGDLLITIKIPDHHLYQRVENDLHLDTFVDIYTMILGGESKITTLGGTLKINIAPDTQTAKVLKLKGQGMPIYSNPDQRGDLYLKLIARLPQNLSEKEKELFKQLKDLQK